MLGHQPNHVTKEERVENLWKKLIRQETDLSEETIAWMALRIRQLTEYMPYGCALIAYRKQNGEFYMARGTLIYYESDFHRKYDIERIKNHVAYWDIEQQVNPEKPDVPLNKNDAFQKVQKRRVQEKR